MTPVFRWLKYHEQNPECLGRREAQNNMYRRTRQDASESENQLLNLVESGRIKVDQQRKSYDFEIKGVKVFATCKDIKRLSKPLQSRFRRLFLPRYTEQQFLDVSEKVLSKLSSSLARYIGANVWKSEGDMRDVISIKMLVRKSDSPQERMKTLTSMEPRRIEEGLEFAFDEMARRLAWN